MTTYEEQILLNEELIGILDFLNSPIPSVLDFTASASIIFATITILAFMVDYGHDIILLLFAAIKHFIFTPLHDMKPRMSFLKKQIAAIQSFFELRFLLNDLMNEVMSLTLPGRLISAAVSWYIDCRDPFDAFVRLFSLAFVKPAYFVIWLLGAKFLLGFADGLGSGGEALTGNCMGVVGLWHYYEELSQEERILVHYCIGGKVGLGLRAVLDEWHLVDGEIFHLRVLAFVGVCVLLMTLVALYFDPLDIFTETTICEVFDVLPRSAATEDSKSHEIEVRETLDASREAILHEMIRNGEVQFAKQEMVLVAKINELEEVKRQMEEVLATVKLPSPVKVDDEFQKWESKIVEQQREEIAEKDEYLIAVKRRFRLATTEAIRKEQSLTDKIASLENNMAAEEERSWKKKEVADNSVSEIQSLNSEIQSLKSELQTGNDQVVAYEQRLATVENESKVLCARNIELMNLNQQLVAKSQEQEASLDLLPRQMSDAMIRLQDERDTALQNAEFLQNQLSQTQANTELWQEQAEATIGASLESELYLQQTMKEIKEACEMTIKEKIKENEEDQNRVAAMRVEIADLERQTSMAMRDLQRSHERAIAPEKTIEDLEVRLADAEEYQVDAANAKKTIEVLEHRLARWENKDSSQEIPKRQIGDLGCMSTALDQSQVTIVAQQALIKDLQRQHLQAMPGIRPGTPRPFESANGIPEENITQRLQAALERESRERKNDQVRWHSRTQELEAEIKKLRTSLSNADASRLGKKSQPSK